MAKRRSAKAPTDPVINPPEEPVVDVPEKAPTDPTLDPVPDEPVDVPEIVEIEGNFNDFATLASALGVDLEIVDPLAPVKVRNLGKRVWGGSDYAAVGSHAIQPGGVGVVTRRKAEDLVAGRYSGAPYGVGPFELVEE